MNKNSLNQKGFIVPALLGVIALFVIGGGFYVYKNKNVEAPVIVNETQQVKNQNIQPIQNNSDEITARVPEDRIVDPQAPCDSKATPSLKVLSPNGGETFTLGQTINIKWSSKCTDPNKTVLLSIGIKDSQAVSELLSMEVKNSGSYDFTIPSNYNLSGYNSNKYDVTIDYVYGNGDAVSDKSDGFFTIINSDQSKTMSVKVFFPKNNAGASDCSVVYPFNRTISSTLYVASAAMVELSKGPTVEEKKLGYFGVIPEGTKINSISLVGSVISVDFNKNIENDFTTCSGAARLSAINKTLLQFPTIKLIKYSVEGNSNPDQIFQP